MPIHSLPSPFEFPSIFSFFLADYEADSGPTVPARLVSPEAALLTMPNTLQCLNGMFSMIKFGLSDCEGGFTSDIESYASCSDNGLYERSYGKLTHVPNGTTFSQEAKDLALYRHRITPGNAKFVKLKYNFASESSSHQESQ